MVEISEDVVERMVSLVRGIAAERAKWADPGDWHAINTAQGDEARAIVALLPEPVDPDIAEVNRLVDESPMVGGVIVQSWMLKALKRGRELALTSHQGEAGR
ncbi:hypothetical protein [Sphingomonas sp. SRS2]|uniref:hypothetical protein n=1 Tax=Sphingomonas sp. SRS2 TaxID=133190 RepID=UPI0006184EA9|nr:hypothetical protein [Sphingomonas sp. SRS2]KKC25795.1 hypothetical protein WP12_12115 [Sphingomonas sp. SRS2]